MAVILFVVSAPLSLSAQPASSRAPEKEFARFVLPNGLEVMAVENRFVPIVTIELAVRNGSFTEGPEYAGLSHLYEHMFFKANSEYKSSEEFISRLGTLGILYNASTREEVVNYYFTLPVSNLEKGMEVMSDAVQFPYFDEAELEREREVVLGEFDRQESSPLFAFDRVLDSLIWGDHVVRKQPIGQRAVIQSATPEKMRTIQKKYYLPNNSLLIVAGDIDSATVYRLARKYFSSWKEGPDPFKNDPPPMAHPLMKKTFAQVPSPLDLAVIEYRWHGPSVGIDNAATYAADVFIYILAQQQSRFQRRLVESGVCDGAGFNYYTQRYVGPISLQVSCKPENIRRALDAVWQEIQAFDAADYFTDEELETSKESLRMRSLYESEETSDWVHTPAFWWSTTGLDYYTGYIDNLARVTRADIQRFVRQYIKDKNYVLGVTSNPQALSRAHLTAQEVLR